MTDKGKRSRLFQAEDFSQVMQSERRKHALQRQLVSFQAEMEKERKGKEGTMYAISKMLHRIRHSVKWTSRAIISRAHS